jgi:hypothetical protein
MEARVVEVSEIPDPKKNAYPTCLFAVKVEPRVSPGGIPDPILLVMPAFRDRILTDHARLQVEDVLRVTAAPFTDMPKAYQSLQLADDTTEIDLPVLAALSVAKQDGYSADPTWEWHGLASADVDPVRSAQPISDVAQRARDAALARDLASIEARLAAHGDWASWYDALAPLRAELVSALETSADGFLRDDPHVFFFDGGVAYELRDEDERYQSVLQSFQLLRDEFAKLGTDLLVLPIPIRDQVYAAKFTTDMPEDGVLQPYWLKFHHDLLVRDIEVIDLLPAYRKALDEEAFLFHYNTKDGHPATAGVLIAAEALAKRLERYTFATPRRDYQTQPHGYGPHRDLGLLFPISTGYPSVLVGESEGGIIQNEDVSEVLLIGDSMVNAPAQARHGQLAHHLIRHAGFPVSIFKRAGSAHQITRSLHRDVGLDYLSGRKVCIFAFAFMAVPHGNGEWVGVPFVSARDEFNQGR